MKAFRTRFDKLRQDTKSLENADPLTRAVALDVQGDAAWYLYLAGDTVDLDVLVRMAEDAHTLLPSAGTRKDLVSSCAARAAARIARLRPDWQKALDARRYWILLTLADMIRNAGDLKAAILKDPDVQKIVELARADARKFPGNPGTQLFNLVRHLDPDLGAGMAAAIKKNENALLRDEIDFLLAPHAFAGACDVYWRYELRGDSAACEQVRKTLTSNGIDWPLKQ